jgi:hypothetical protein
MQPNLRAPSLSEEDAKTIPNVFTSHPTIRNVENEKIITASGVDGIQRY